MTDLKGTGAHPQDTAAAAAFLDSQADLELVDVDPSPGLTASMMCVPLETTLRR